MENREMQTKPQPTLTMYTFIQNAYDFFNDRLFGKQLPDCMFTFQREKSVMGYFASDRWAGENNITVHEIALNPSYFITHRPVELMQTLVHEMCHLWQHEFGTPSQRTYHNKEWADKMESIGLMPSSTGQPGGKRTGQKMSDYPIKNGAFYFQCIVFAQSGFHLPYYDRWARVESAQVREPTPPSEQPFEEANHPAVAASTGYVDADPVIIMPTPEIYTAQDEGNESARLDAERLLMQPFSEQFNIDVGELSPERELESAAKKKATYQCPSCKDKAWGKPTLSLVCGKCQKSMSKFKNASTQND